jgi:hypothetical protein
MALGALFPAVDLHSLMFNCADGFTANQVLVNPRKS